MKTLKLFAVAAVAAFGIAVAQAGQPVVWSFALPDIPACSAPNSPTNIPVANFALTTTSGGTSSNLDTEFQTHWVLNNILNAKTSGGAGTVEGIVVYQCTSSGDGVSWFPGPLITNTLTTTNGPNVLSQDNSSTLYRYVSLTNIYSTVTNAAIWSSNKPIFQIFWKTP